MDGNETRMLDCTVLCQVLHFNVCLHVCVHPTLTTWAVFTVGRKLSEKHSKWHETSRNAKKWIGKLQKFVGGGQSNKNMLEITRAASALHNQKALPVRIFYSDNTWVSFHWKVRFVHVKEKGGKNIFSFLRENKNCRCCLSDVCVCDGRTDLSCPEKQLWKPVAFG